MFRPVLAAAVTLLVSLAPTGSVAASAICEQLRFDLANVRQGSSATSDARKFARAIAEQWTNLRQLDFAMRRQGCSSGSMIVIDSEPNGACEGFDGKRDRMQRNLEILERKRAALLSENPSGLARQQLVRALEDNGCNDEPVLVHALGEGIEGESLVSDTADGFETIRVPSTDPDYGDSQFVDLGGTARNGNFRTMCVRACDGAFFPVSSHASSLNFRRDAQVCSMMCPGTETELFYHSIQQESAEMRSTSNGRAYQDLPNAYLFRTQKLADKGQCGCNFSLYYKEMLKREAFVKDPASQPQNQSAIVWTKPELRGGLTKEVAEIKPKIAARAYQPNARIRIIGPRFLPDDSALDFRTPTASLQTSLD